MFIHAEFFLPYFLRHSSPVFTKDKRICVHTVVTVTSKLIHCSIKATDNPYIRDVTSPHIQVKTM